MKNLKKVFTLIMCCGLALSSSLFNCDVAKATENQEDIVTFSAEEHSYLVETVDPNATPCYVDVRTRGATDEYYYLESHRTYGNEFVIKTERYSAHYDAGVALVTFASASGIKWIPAKAGTILSATFTLVKNYIPLISDSYNTVVTHYGVYGEAVYRVEVAGQFRRYATYSDLKVPTKKVYNYS